MSIRLVTYNVRYFSHALRGLASTRRSVERIARALAELTPTAHVICLQEVEQRSLRSTFSTRQHPTQLDALLHAIGPRYQGLYFPAHTSRLHTTGQAILVDTSVLSIREHEPHVLTLDVARGERRVVGHAQLGHDRSTLHIWNAHLSLPSPLLGTRLGYGANQLAQTERLLALVDEHSAGQPLVLCGDFNAAPGSPVVEMLVSTLTSCAGPRHSAGVGPLRMRLDYVFGRHVQLLDEEDTHSHGDRESRFHGLSDHVPLVTRLDWP